MAEHSPTPWHVDGIFILDSDGGAIAAMCEPDYEVDAALICDAVNLKTRIDEAIKDKDGFLHPVMLEGRPCVCVTPPPSECELERMSREVISGLTKDRALLQRQSYAASKELNRLSDLVQSYGDTIVKLNEAAQRSELAAIHLRGLVRRLAEYIRREGSSEVFITSTDPKQNYHVKSADLLREAREVLGEEEP